MTDSPPIIVALPGDGPGPELLDAARRILSAAGLHADWREHEIGSQPWQATGTAVPPETLQACREADAVLLGTVMRRDEERAEADLPPELQGNGHTWVPPILQLKAELDLWVDIRPIKGNGYDLVVCRENRQGLYAGYEAHPVPAALQDVFPGMPVGADAAVALRITTKDVLELVFHAAFGYAKAHNRQKVTLIDKPTRMPTTGRFILDVFRRIASEHDLMAETMNADAALAHLVRDRGAFDVITAMDLPGELISDLAAELAGGLALHASASHGDHHALFQPVIDPAPGLADLMVPPNPIGAVRAAALAARHVGQTAAAQRVESAIEDLLVSGERHEWTPDLGGTGNTNDTAQALLERVRAVVAASG